MASNWIKVRIDLWTDPTVGGIAEESGLDEMGVIGRLVTLWSIADAHTVTGVINGMSESALDAKLCAPGFADALKKFGWLTVKDGWVCIPKFDRHNGNSAKRRALDASRKSASRPRPVRKVSASKPDETRIRTEKNRTDKNQELVATQPAPTRRSAVVRAAPPPGVVGTTGSVFFDKGKHQFVHRADDGSIAAGVPPDTALRWKAAYPAVDVDGEILRAGEWVGVNIAVKGRKANYERFLNGWLSRCQERGGSRHEPNSAQRPARDRELTPEEANPPGCGIGIDRLRPVMRDGNGNLMFPEAARAKFGPNAR
jgi:hypothetical protein